MGFEKWSSCQDSREIPLNYGGLQLEILILPPVLSVAAISAENAEENDGRNKLDLEGGLNSSFVRFHRKT